VDKKRRNSFGILVAILVLLLSPGLLWGQERWGEEAFPTEAPAEAKEALPKKPVTPPGYFPGIPSSTPYGSMESGPSAGALAPYGNPATYDNLKRGWHSLHIGNVIITPYFESDGLYRSNIYLTPSHKLSDFIFVLTPGLQADVPIAGKNHLSLGYLGTGFIYTTHGANSHYDQNFNANLALKLKSGWYLRFGNTLRLATEERNSEFSMFRRYIRNSPYVNASYAFADRWKVEANYQFDTLSFFKTADQVNNYNQQGIGATLYYRFLPKTSALVQYIFTYREFPNVPADNTYNHSPLVGVSWEPTAKLSGTIKYGYTLDQYQTSVPGRNNSPSGFTMSMNLLYRYSRATNLTLTAQRAFLQDVDFNNAGNYNTGVWVAVNHDWTFFKLTSYASFYYLNINYLNPALDSQGQFLRRLDNIVGVGVGLNRLVTRWLRARLDYSYSNRASNFPGYSYNDNRVLIGLQTSF
jgi:hypothetical protein